MAVRLTKDAERQLRGGHPWMYDASILSQSHEGAPGDIVIMFDAKRKFLAVGLYDPHSPIRIKVLQARSQTTINHTFWSARIDAALSRRATLVADIATTAYRVINGENDGLPGVIVDRYADSAVLKIYSAAWFAHLDGLRDAIVDRTGVSTVVLRMSRHVRQGETYGLSEGDALFGEIPVGPIHFLENGLTFEADLVRGQKTGHFLDQRDNRQLVRSLAAGASVLDVFACTGGFSIYAAAGGARSAHRVDISAAATATADRNISANSENALVMKCAHRATVGDAYEVLEDLRVAGAHHDIVVVDPPSFAKNKNEVRGALDAYARLTDAALKVLNSGGLLVQASCTSRVTAVQLRTVMIDAARRSGIHLDVLHETEHAIDHPVTFPQGSYLKACFVRRG